MNTNDLTMIYPNTFITPTELNPILRLFAEKLWSEFIKNKKAGTNDITNMASEYWNVVNSLIGEKKTVDNNKKRTKAKKPKIPVPFYGTVEDGWCCGIKKNHGLYTQCCKPRPKDGDYCKVCARQAQNNADGKPNCGDIRERAQQWTTDLKYRPPGMKQEIPYANVMSKLNITTNEAQEAVESLGWEPIPNCHLVEKKVRRGRPKTKVAVEDSDDETPKKKRGRPKKQPKKEITDEELIAQFMASAI